jgi:hypothetical protein
VPFLIIGFKLIDANIVIILETTKKNEEKI